MLNEQQLQAAMEAARPGTIIEVHVRILVPADGAVALPAATVPDIHPRGEVEASHDAPQTPLERLQSMRRDGGDKPRKEGEWAKCLCQAADFPARELDRACQQGVIPHEPKTVGKDAGARMIAPCDLEVYLRLRERVQRGLEPAPMWWTSVVMPRNRTAA